MTNYFDNVVYLTRNTSITMTELDDWSWFEFEYYITSLKQALEKEAEQKKKEQKTQLKNQMSMKAQLDQYLRSAKSSYKFKK